MKSSGVGGQAVIEGVMMRHKNLVSVAVRNPEGAICVQTETDSGFLSRHPGIKKVPFLRGIFVFGNSMAVGMRALNYASSFYDETGAEEKKGAARLEEICVTGLSFAFAILLFMVVPYLAATLLKRSGIGQTGFALAEGLIRLTVFFLYIILIGKIPDMKRVFMYHGAEHKCINCIEQGLPLTVDNVRKSSREHRRCGTSFLFYVILISILLHTFITADGLKGNILLRLVLIPVVMGLSYEFIRLAGNSDHALVVLLSRPGLFLQGFTTAEPDDAQIEVGIASVEAVFDWKAFEKEVFHDIL